MPDDLLRLSIGLEALEDLVIDLKRALETAVRGHPIGVPVPLVETEPTAPTSDDLAAAVVSVLERSAAPLAIARGGEIRLVELSDGIVTLEACGSPGALRPAIGQIEALLRAALPQVTRVRFVWPAMEPASDQGSSSLADRVRRVLKEEMNPAIAHHRGRVELVDVVDGMAHLRLEGGCQGCSLAAVTVRQGIEPLLREHVPEIAGVVDVTDHQAGSDPFYSAAKR